MPGLDREPLNQRDPSKQPGRSAAGLKSCAQVAQFILYDVCVMSERVLSRRPLTASSRDQKLFVESPEHDRAIAAITMGTNVFISGTPGSGKTTLAHRIASEVDGAVIVKAEWAETVPELIGAITNAVSGQSNSGPTYDDPNTRTERSVAAVGDALRTQTGEGLPVKVVVIDGIDAAQLAVLFGRFRDALWELQLTWVVTSRSKAPEPPADAFFDTVITIAPWESKQLADLARRRVPDVSSGFVEIIETIAPTTPANAIRVLQTYLSAADPTELINQLRAERDQVETLPGRLQDLYDALRSLGAVSASDQRLAVAVGVSRSRLTHGLKELEELGLVHAEREGKKVLYRTTGPGFNVETGEGMR